jgi:uncharacterized protein (TIGR03435 family)
MGRILAALSLITFLPFGAAAQNAFEVASVRPNRTRDRGSMEFPKGRERFTATNMPLAAIILVAYDITVRQLSGSDPLLSERYDIAATAEHAVGRDEMLRMLQALLVERFHLVVRRETREVPVYALTVARGGPKLHRSDLAEDDARVPRTPARAGGTEQRSGYLIFKGESMPDFAWALSRTVATGDRVVVDQTGLSGIYDFELSFERETAPAGADVRETGLQGPSIFSALEEQFGLKLEPRRAPVEFLVIEHVERPTAN